MSKTLSLDLMMVVNKFLILEIIPPTTEFWKGVAYNRPLTLLLFIPLGKSTGQIQLCTFYAHTVTKKQTKQNKMCLLISL